MMYIRSGGELVLSTLVYLILTSVSSIFVTLNTNAVSASLDSAWNKVLTLVWNLGMKGQSSVMIFFLSLATSQMILHALAYVMTLS